MGSSIKRNTFKGYFWIFCFHPLPLHYFVNFIPLVCASMPSLVRVGVSRARDLPIMDSSVQGDASTDAFVEVRLGDDVKRTNT